MTFLRELITLLTRTHEPFSTDLRGMSPLADILAKGLRVLGWPGV